MKTYIFPKPIAYKRKKPMITYDHKWLGTYISSSRKVINQHIGEPKEWNLTYLFKWPIVFMITINNGDKSGIHFYNGFWEYSRHLISLRFIRYEIILTIPYFWLIDFPKSLLNLRLKLEKDLCPYY